MSGDGATHSAEDITLPTSDGVNIAATLYQPAPQGGANGVAVLLNSSMATPRQYYRAFCTHLAQRGFAMLTYDYRGVGGSEYDMPPPPACVSRASAIIDQSTAADFLSQRFGQFAPMVLGHSFGGQILGMSPHASRWRAVLLVCTAHGYWAKWPLLQKPRIWWRSLLMGPLFLKLPAWLRQRLTKGSNLPVTVMHEVMIYMRSRHFFVDEQRRPLRPHNDALNVPLRHITFSDDEVVPPGAEIEVPFTYPNAIWLPEPKRPEDYGVKGVGHFGFFKRTMPVSAWDDVGDWLLAQAQAPKTQKL